jgi:methylenetetrahydrofolate dehydrogenase (NADP+)/methenyltetrahydrofolate cyclohydrolase
VTADLIDGNAIAAELKDQLQAELAELGDTGPVPGLATLQVGDDYAASAYERRVRRLAEAVGVRYDAVHLPADAGPEDVLATIGGFNADPRVSGVLVLRPLGSVHDETAIFRTLDPTKDIEAVNPANAGLLALGVPRFVPSTPASCFHLLDMYLDRSGRDKKAFYERSLIVCIGRSNNVGKPAMLLAMARNATVISCDVHTSRAGRLLDLTRQADVLVVAAGVAGLIGAEHVSPGAIVIDVGINPARDPESGRTKMVGDVVFDEVREKASALTPVPGGVGPVTDVWLLRNTVSAAWMARKGAGHTPLPVGL